MVILWVNIRVQLPPSWNPVFGATWLRFSSRLRFRTRARNPVGPRPGYIFSCWLVYTYTCHWPVAYLMMLSNWILSCQAWPPLARYGQWARSKHWRTAVYFLYKMSWSSGAYLRCCQTNSAGIFKWHNNMSSLLVQNFEVIWWDHEKLLCFHRVKICKFTKNKQGVNQCFHLHARAPPAAVLGWVEERILNRCNLDVKF